MEPMINNIGNRKEKRIILEPPPVDLLLDKQIVLKMVLFTNILMNHGHLRE